jgi:hypothetical protein
MSSTHTSGNKTREELEESYEQQLARMEGEGQAMNQSHIGEGQVKESSNIKGQSSK